MTISATNSVSGLSNLLQKYAAQATSNQSAIKTTGTGTDADGITAVGKAGQPQATGLRDKIQSAIASALQNAPSGSDPNQVIQDTLTKLLGTRAAKDHHHKHANGSEGKDAGPDAQQADFQKLLPSYGVDATQLQKDFQSALAKAQGGNFDPAAAFKSLPPGTDVNTVA